MSLHRLGAALAAALAASALAADPSDPAAPVPPPSYRSALPPPTDLAEPVVPWVQANQDVARFPRGHVDLLRWEERQGKEPAGAAASPAAHPGKRHDEAH